MGLRQSYLVLAWLGAFAFSAQAAPRPARTDEAADSPQVAAATAEASSNLRDEILRSSVTRRVTVGEFLRRTGSEAELTRALERAELVGGPRWVDKDTCQVQLDFTGARVAHLLQQIQSNKPKDSPVTASDLTELAASWSDRTFSGIGSSTAFGRAEKIRPAGIDAAWAGVSDADRQKALALAKADAVENVIDSLKPIRLNNEKTVGDVLANRDVRAALADWLANRPVTRVEYRRDLRVELTMAGTPGGCFDIVRGAITKFTDLAAPKDEAAWARVRNEFEKTMATPVGRSLAVPTLAPPVAANIRVTLPQVAPDWIDRKIEVEAAVESAGSPLKSAGEARTAARKKLADALAALPLTRRLTVGQAAEQDDRLRAALSRVLDKAEAKTDYSRHNAVAVTLRSDLHDLWDALRASQ